MEVRSSRERGPRPVGLPFDFHYRPGEKLIVKYESQISVTLPLRGEVNKASPEVYRGN